MTYIDGFVIAVPADKKDAFVRHARTADPIFVEEGATRVVECWEDDVPDGELTDFRRAVAAEGHEKVAVAWIEWPDKATRDRGMARCTELMRTDPRMDPAANPPPFDGRRMIFGGFAAVVDERFREGAPGYVDCVVVPVPAANKDAYVKGAADMAEPFGGHGALFDVETWGDDVPDGKLTDFRRAVKAQGDEVVGLSFVGWPDKATRDAGWAKIMAGPPPGAMPFDGRRMFWGGFAPVVQVQGK